MSLHMNEPQINPFDLSVKLNDAHAAYLNNVLRQIHQNIRAVQIFALSTKFSLPERKEIMDNLFETIKMFDAGEIL